MKRRTRRLSLIGAIALICLTSGVLVAHARQATAEVKVDCLIFNGAGTGQTSCPGGVTIQSTGNQVFTIGIVGSGGIQTTCTHVFSSISPTFATLQGLGPFHVQTPQFNDTTSISDSGKSFGSGATVTYTNTTLTDTTKAFPASFVGTTVEAVDATTNPITPYTGTVASVSGTTITLTATGWTTPSLNTHPVNGDQYQVAPCTDTLGGHTMTVTRVGWVETDHRRCKRRGFAGRYGTVTA